MDESMESVKSAESDKGAGLLSSGGLKHGTLAPKDELCVLEKSLHDASSLRAEALSNLNNFFNQITARLNERKCCLERQILAAFQQREMEIREKVRELNEKENQTTRPLSNVSFASASPEIPSASSEMPLFYPSYRTAMTELTDRLGLVDLPSTLPTSVKADGEGLQYCTPKKRTVVHAFVRNASNQPVHADIHDLQGELKSHNGSSVSPVTVLEWQEGAFALSYESQREGTYRLDVKFRGEHITGSPFRVRSLSKQQVQLGLTMDSSTCKLHGKRTQPSRTRRKPLQESVYSASPQSRPTSEYYNTGSTVQSFPFTCCTTSSLKSNTTQDDDLLLKIGGRGRNFGHFTNPQDVCCLDDGRLAVTDSSNQCVQVFSADGDPVLRFGLAGRQPGYMLRPTGIAFSNGRLYVSDYDCKWINVFDTSGRFVCRFGAGKLLGPKGVCVTEEGEIVVVDNKANAIVIFNKAHRFSRRIKPHSKQSEYSLTGPHFVAAHADRLFVTDFHSHSVKVFSLRDGAFLTEFGRAGETPGEFRAPTGIAVDQNGDVLVADWGNCRVQIFDMFGIFQRTVQSGIELFGPQGIAVGASGQLLVANSGGHSVDVFSYA